MYTKSNEADLRADQGAETFFVDPRCCEVPSQVVCMLDECEPFASRGDDEEGTAVLIACAMDCCANAGIPMPNDQCSSSIADYTELDVFL